MTATPRAAALVRRVRAEQNPACQGIARLRPPWFAAPVCTQASAVDAPHTYRRLRVAGGALLSVRGKLPARGLTAHTRK